jgi:hypothetical protein
MISQQQLQDSTISHEPTIEEIQQTVTDEATQYFGKAMRLI